MKQKMTAQKDIKKNPVWIKFLIFTGIIFLIYAKTISFDFTKYDDSTIVQKIKITQVEDGFLKKIFTTDAYLEHRNPLYRPLQTLSFYFDTNIGKKNELHILHLHNIILFILIAFSLYYFFINLKLTNKLSFWIVVIFIVHPIMVTSVAWIPARGDLQLTIFTLLSFIFFIRFLKTNNIFDALIFPLSFLLALFSKETAAVIPLLILLYILINKIPIKINYKLIIIFLLSFSGSIFWFTLRTKAVNLDNTNEYSLHIIDALSNIKQIPVAISQYIVPYEFATLPRITWTKIAIGLIFILLLIFITLKNKKVNKEIIFGFIWFLLFMLPTFTIKQYFIDYFDHRFMLPFIGFILAIILTFKAVNKKNNLKFLYPILVLFAIVSYFKADGYKNLHNYIDFTLKYNGRKEVAYVQRGIVKQSIKDFDGAINDYSLAIKASPSYATAYNNRGAVKFAIGLYKESIEDFTLALTKDIKYANCYENRAKAYYQLKNYNAALSDFTNAKKFNINLSSDFYYSLGMTYIGLKNYQSGITYLDSCIVKDQNYTQAYYDKGVALLNIQNYNDALICFDKAILLNPTFLDAYYIRAATRLFLSNFQGAMDDCNTILSYIKNDQNALALIEKIKPYLK